MCLWLMKMIIPTGQSQAIWKCKWRHLVTKFGSEASGATRRLLFVSSVHFVTCASGSFCWPSFRIRPDFRILIKFQDFDQISRFWPDFRILTKFQDFYQISGFQPNFRISTKFQDFDQISGFWPNFRMLTKFQDFNQISGI